MMWIDKKETILAHGINKLGREMLLTHRPAGGYVAGSGVRMEGDSWGWMIEMNGARHGQRFKSLEAAQEAFNARLAQIKE